MPDTCVFVGRYNPTCGSEAVAFFVGDGTAVVLSLAPSATTPPLFIAAQALSATEGKLVLWRSDLDFKQAPSVGSVHLENNGQRLVVRLDPGLANAGGCPIQEFVGRFAGMAVANDASGPRRPGPIAAIAAVDRRPDRAPLAWESGATRELLHQVGKLRGLDRLVHVRVEPGAQRGDAILEPRIGGERRRRHAAAARAFPGAHLRISA